MRTIIAAGLIAGALALTACDRSDKAEVHKAGSDLKAAGTATVGAAKDLATAAAHDLKTAGGKVSGDLNKAGKDHPDKARDSGG